MVRVGIRELKQQASELIRIGRETGKEIQITSRGEVVALLIPVKRAKNSNQAWAKLDDLAVEVGEHWPKGVSAYEDHCLCPECREAAVVNEEGYMGNPAREEYRQGQYAAYARSARLHN